MIHLSAKSEIMLARYPQDFRKGIDGFVAVCRHELEHNSKTGIIFVFINRSHTMVRLLTYENKGYWLMTKRLSKGKFKYWPSDKQAVNSLLAWQLRALLCNTDQPFYPVK